MTTQTDLQAQVLPHSLEAEKAVLGAVLVNAAMWAPAASVIKAADFFRYGHQIVFDTLGELVAQGAAVDLVTLAAALGARLDEAGGRSYLAGLTDGVPLSTNVIYYAKIVREKAALRAAIAAGQTLVADAYAAGASAADLVEQTMAQLGAIIEVPGAGLAEAHVAIRDYLNALADGSAGLSIATGYTDLDALLGGFKPGDLIILAARPSVGKTALALGIGQSVAESQRRVAFFSLEMSRQALAARLVAHHARVSVSRLEAQLLDEQEMAHVAALLTMAPVPLLIEDTSHTITEIGAWCRRIQSEGGLALAIVDYLQLLMAEQRSDSREAEVSGISRALKRLARDLDVPLLVLSQLSRAPEARKDKRPHLSDLRGSGALEQDCDVALLLFREEMHSPTEANRGVAEVIAAKHRNGPIGVVRLAFLADWMKFENLAHQSEMY